MANWKNLGQSEFHIVYEDEANTYPAQKEMNIILQYDADSMTPISVKVRFMYWNPDSEKVYGDDGMYILYNANATEDNYSRKVLKIKGSGTSGAEAYYTSSITLTKSYTTEYFFLQDVWVCNTGSGTVNVDAGTVKYSTGTKSFYDWFKVGGVRENYAYRQDQGQRVYIEKSKTAATTVEKGTVTITDNYDNSFTVKCTRGAAGTNNPVTGATLWWAVSKKSDGSWDYKTEAFASEKTTHSKTITFTPSASATRKVAAAVTTSGTYGAASDTGWKTSDINQYKAPDSPEAPTLTESSYKNSKLTNKKNWSFEWAPAKANASPVVGYRIRLYKNTKGVKLTTNDNTSDPVYDTDVTTYKLLEGVTYKEEDTKCQFTIDPVKFEFKAEDTVQLSLFAYSRYGKANTGSILWSGKGSNATLSKIYTVQNAGVVQVKVGDSWKEGQVYVKVNDTWKEADTVYTKIGDDWKESQ